MWILTTEYNEYNQQGEYYVQAFLVKPTFKILKELTKENDVTVGKLTRGGGRHGVEEQWYNLFEVKE